jgi:hypothetical protein
MNDYDQKCTIANLLRQQFPQQTYEMITGISSWLVNVKNRSRHKTSNPVSNKFLNVLETAFRCNWIIETIQGFNDAHDFTSSIPNTSKLKSVSKMIGQGAYGVVYRGVLQDDTVIAVKKYAHLDRKSIHENVCDWGTCMKEISMLSRLQGSGIVGDLHGIGWFQHSWVVVMQLHSLSSLQWKSHELWSVERTKQIVRDLYSAVRTVHEITGHTHGDVKPCNVMLDIVDGNPKLWLIDFGLSEPLGSITAGHTYVQTVYWRMPKLFEQLECDLATADLWATTITAFDIMTGKCVMCDLGANHETTDDEMLAIIQTHVLGRTTVPEQWSIHEELIEFANELYLQYIVCLP